MSPNDVVKSPLSSRVAALAAIILVGGCGGGSGPTAEKACADLAQAACAKRMTCSNGTSVTRAYGTMEACVTRETLNCTDALAAPHTGNSPSVIEQCVAAYSGYSCADFFNNVPPAACAPAGPGAAGASCTFNGQCATAYCANLKNALCGTCAAPPVAGASCASTSCGHGQECVQATTLCQPEGALSAPCDADNPCGYGLSCVGAVASTSTPGICQAAGTAPGAACGGTLPGCDGTSGLFCGGAAGAKTCMTVVYANDGMPCGDLSDTSRVDCIAGACYTATGLAGGGDMGVCKASAMEGQACDTATGPGCLGPARCVSSGTSTLGICTLPTGTACGAS